jgi:hypothetical protein
MIQLRRASARVFSRAAGGNRTIPYVAAYRQAREPRPANVFRVGPHLVFGIPGIERHLLSERKVNERASAPGSNANVLTEVADRRRAVRKPFIAEALVVEVDSGAKLSGRSCDLVVQGFYMDTLNPLPQDTQVLVRLQHGESRVEAAGRVVYRVPGLGMGIAFNDLSADHQAILNRWLSESRDDDGNFQASLPPISVEPFPAPVRTEAPLVRLIRVLLKKGILTKTEADDIVNGSADLEL